MFDVYYRGSAYPVGTHIRVRRPYGIDHHGIVVGGSAVSLGPMMVIDNAKGGGVSCRTLDEVAGGDPVEVVARPQSAKHAAHIVEQAYSQIGKPYDLFSRNCEHFSNWCYSGMPRSLQLQGYVMLAAVIGLVIVSSGK